MRQLKQVLVQQCHLWLTRLASWERGKGHLDTRIGIRSTSNLQSDPDPVASAPSAEFKPRKGFGRSSECSEGASTVLLIRLSAHRRP